MSNLVAFTPKYPLFPSDLLVKLRHRSGLSQSQLAELFGLKSERMVLYWEGGYSLPPAARLRKLIELFLTKGVFLAGQEMVEIEQLWTVVKDFYDNTCGKNLPYPVFDRTWVAALVGASSTTIKNKIPPVAEPAKAKEATAGQDQNEDTTISTPALPVKPDLSDSGAVSAQVITPPNNLFRFQTPATLLGREKELQDLEARLIGPGGSLIVLTGPGGVGKTRLALEVAKRVLASFKDGVYFINLAEISNSEQVPAAIGQELNLKVQSATTDEELNSVYKHLNGKKFLLVLDNFEQLAKSAAMLNKLFNVAREGELKILITSRVDLNLYGEQRYWLEPLGLPVKSTQSLTQLPTLMLEHLNHIQESYSVRLFVERARLVRPDFQLTPQNALAIARICELVDGLPLALELAAARIQLFTPQALLKRLGEDTNYCSSADRESGQLPTNPGSTSLKWLNYNPGTSSKRQENLRQTLQWSYNLLNEGQQNLFRQLAVFRGGFTLAAVCSICYSNSNPNSNPNGAANGEEGPEEAEVLNSLADLVNNSLIRSNYDQDGEPRFVVLKTINEFATQLLNQGDCTITEELRERHALYYLKLAEEALPHYQGKNQATWFEKTANEQDNMRAALEWLFGSNRLKLTARLVYALNPLWFRRGLMSQELHWVRRTIAAIERFENELEQPKTELTNGFDNTSSIRYVSEERATQQQNEFEDMRDVKLWLGRLLWQLGTYIGNGFNLESALLLIQKGLALSIQVEDTTQLIKDYHSLGYISMNSDRMEEAISYLEQGAALARRENNYSFLLTGILANLGVIFRNKQKYDQAQSILNEGLVLSQQHCYKSSELMFLGTLGQLNLDRKDPDKARRYFTQVLRAAKEIEAPQLAAITHLNMAGLEIFNSFNLSQAKLHLKQALLLDLERDFKLGLITVMILLGVILARQGEIEMAARFAQTIEVELQGSGQKLHGQELQWYQAFQEAVELGLCQKRKELAHYYTEDNYLSFSQALSLALEQLN